MDTRKIVKLKAKDRVTMTLQLDTKYLAGSFSYYRDGSQSNPVSYMYAHDINNDGVDEVVLVAFETQPNTPAKYSNTSVHIFGWSQNRFQEVTSQWLPGSSNQVEGVGDVAFGDFNGDGREDMFLSAYTDMDHPVNAYALYNTGSSFNKVSLGSQTWQHSVRSYDINHDGYADVIPTGYADMPRYLGSANGLTKYSGFTGGSGLAIGDFMNNGTASVIFVDAGTGLNDTYLDAFDFSTPGMVNTRRISQLPGPRLESIAPTAGSHDIRAVPMDFNDDGLLDVIVIGYGFGLDATAKHRSEIQFLQNKGSGVFEDVTSTTRLGFDVSGYVGYTPQLVDVNQDGLLDLFLSMPDWLPSYNSTTLLSQQPDHTFVDTARSILTRNIESGGGQGLIVQGPNNTNYLVTEGAWSYNNPQTKLYIQSITFTERSNSEQLTGTRQADNIDGMAGNDTLTGAAGNDTLNGGEGTDTATYSGNVTSYTLRINRAAQTASIADQQTNRDGQDSLKSIERLQFADVTLNLSIFDEAKTIPPAQLQKLEELYVAFFNRAPDADGLSFWITQLKAGQTINDIATSFYSAGVQYTSLTGFSAGMTNTDFINTIYRNVLGRVDGADADGLSYWNQSLSSGQATRGSLVNAILDSAHTFKGNATWGWVADLLDNKISVANTVAVTWGLNYNTPEQSIAQGMAIAAAVTPTDTQAALNLIGINLNAW